MYKRLIQSELAALAKQYPIVTIIGPRQSGKTTLAQSQFPHYKYCSLENPDYRRSAKEDPRSFLREFSDHVIFDEIQRVPELLSYLQEIVDSEQKKGQFILTGSHQLSLRAEISQSLAGRTALLTLLPLSLEELLPHSEFTTKEEFLFYGFFPRIHKDKLDPLKAYANYYQTYVEKDVRQLINIKDVTLFEKFLRLLAGRVGQLLNLHSLANDVGVSSTTLNQWISVLEASFIILRLPPYFENFGKRIIKSPKFYFVDTGLLCYLLDIENIKALKRDPLVGNIFENMVYLEAVKARLNRGLGPNLYFFRDSTGNEVDLLFKTGNQLVPIEIKSSSTYTKEFEKGIHFFQKVTKKSTSGYVIYDGDYFPKTEELEVMNFRETYKIFST